MTTTLVTSPAQNVRTSPDPYRPTAALYETISRDKATAQNVALGTAGVGNMNVYAISLPSGLLVSQFRWISGNVALVNGVAPHYWVALFDLNLALLRQSTDNTSKAIGAAATITDSFATTYTTTYDGLYYIGIMVHSGTSGGTQPTAVGMNYANNQVCNLAPRLAGVDTTGFTTTAPGTAVLANYASHVYGYVL